MVMFSSDANVCCCFRRLGIERGSTERQIKQAFRQLARGSHPDMFTEPTDKERATVAFRELYKTYQEALRAESSGSAAPDQNRNARRTTDSYIRKAFQDTCDEEDRSLDAWRRERWSRLTRSVQEAWPDRDLTWKIVSTGEGWLLSFEIDELASFFEGGSYADISRFLREKLAQRTLERHNKYELEYDQWARYVEDHWPDANADVDADTTLLKEWAKTTWMLLEYKDVADRVRVKIPRAATIIMEWKRERRLNNNKKFAGALKQSAKDIIQVYPDRDAISIILKRHLRSERQELYDLLPETMRLAL
jgi:YD repeat-containing protein